MNFPVTLCTSKDLERVKFQAGSETVADDGIVFQNSLGTQSGTGAVTGSLNPR